MKIIILGKGRIGKAVKYYLKKLNLNVKVGFLNKHADVRNCDLIIAALPGDVCEIALKLALKYKKNLIDISDVEHNFYLKNKKKIEENNILVIPWSGFSPGLINFICGKEVKENKVKEIEIMAGTLSPNKFLFPITWCFEDLIDLHRTKATLIENKKKTKLPAFSGYRKENIEGIESESYFSEGLGTLPLYLKVPDMSERVLRPIGFHIFFRYLEDYGFLDKKNIDFTEKILESKKLDNLTYGEIKIKTNKKQIIWKTKTFSKKHEKLNSMQKITAIFPVLLVKEILEGNIVRKGLFFPEQLGQDENLFKKIISQIKKQFFLTCTV